MLGGEGNTSPTLSERCYEIYEKDGYTGVFDYVSKTEPDRHWFYCEPCEMKTPFDDDRSCLVCASLLDSEIK